MEFSWTSFTADDVARIIRECWLKPHEAKILVLRWRGISIENIAEQNHYSVSQTIRHSNTIKELITEHNM